MKVTQALLSEYRRELDSEAGRARAYFRSAIAEFYRRYPDATVEDTRVFVLDLMGSALPNFLDLASTLACDLFDELADECGFEGEHARLYDTTDWRMVDRKVHYLAGFLAEGDKDRFKSEVADLTHYYCKRAAYDNMVANCRAQRVMWARVPTGLETCAFCFMLASRGFAYTSEDEAKSGDHGYHDHCDCVVVPGFQREDGNPRVKIDGYDPETMYRNWKSCEETIGGRDAARTEWMALPEDERSERIEKADGDASKAFARFEQSRIRHEVETRDWHWLYTGEAPEVDYEKPREKLEEHEKAGVDYAQLHGFRLTVKLEDGGARANIDFEICGNLVELKNVTNASSVSNQIKRARIKWWKLGIDEPMRAVFTTEGCTISYESAIDEVLMRMRPGEEVLLFSRNGKALRRLKK